jgi:hypothetical protein
MKQLLKILEYSYENLKPFLLSDFRHQHYFKILCKYLWHPLLSALPIPLYTNTLDDMTWYNKNEAKHLEIAVFTYKPVAHKWTLPLTFSCRRNFVFYVLISDWEEVCFISYSTTFCFANSINRGLNITV